VFLFPDRLSHIATLLLCAFCGCMATHLQKVEVPHALYARGELDQAAENLTKQLKRPGYRKDVLKLDLATVELARGNADAAESLLREVRDRLDEHSQSDVMESATMLMTDDASRAYAGTGYEQVMVRVLASLTNLMRDGGDAEAYSLQAIEHQRLLAERAGEGGVSVPQGLFQPVAVAPYLRGVLRENTYHDYDDATRAYQMVAAICPQFQLAAADIQRASEGMHSYPDHGVLYVFALVGRGPVREPKPATVTSDALLVADRIVSAIGRTALPPTIAPVMIPTVVIPFGEALSVTVSVNGQPLARTETITDVGQLAIDTDEAERPRVIARAVSRRVLKKAAVYAAKEGSGVRHPLADLGMMAAGVAWEAVERCDTRCWGLLPREIQVARLELPVGDHEIGVSAVSPYHPWGTPQMSTPVRITNGRNTYLIAIAPDDRVIAAPCSH
jgi:hypothetical protein